MSNEPQSNGAQPLKSSFDGTRRILPWVGGGLIAVVVGGYYFFGTTAHAPESAQITHPDMQSPAGGSNHSKTMDDLARKRDEQAAQAALKVGKSYTSALSGQDLPDPQEVASEIGDTPDTTQKPAPAPPPVSHTSAPAPSPAPPAPSFTPSTPPAPSGHFNTTPAEKPAVPERMSERAEMELITAWSGGPRVALEIPGAKGGPGRSGDSGFQTDAAEPATFTQPPAATAASTDAEPASQGTRSGRGTLLLPAGRGVYGHSVLTVNSDLGNAVLMQIDSGPFRNARISGTFEMKSERLVIKFSKLMIGDADPITVSGYAVSPQTAEVGVASEVREHLATRIILPAAAAFVEGLGSAMSNSNTTNYSNGSGMSSFTHLNLGEQMGAAAGTMGQQVGQLIQKQTPQQATVILKQNDGVGVMFDEPVYRP